MTPIAASGVVLQYEDVSEIVEALINTEGRRYPIPDMDHEDIAQEIRLECVRILPHFDQTRIGPSPYKYLQTCIKNFLYNKKRGVWVPNNPPCVRCPMWDRLNKTCIIDEVGCDKIVEYRKNMATKADLRAPASLEIDILDGSSEFDAILLDQSIREAIPDNLMNHYDNLLNGKSIPPRIKKQIREIVTSVINDG